MTETERSKDKTKTGVKKEEKKGRKTNEDNIGKSKN